MRAFPKRLRRAHPSRIFLLLLVFLIVARVSAEPAGNPDTSTRAAQATDDPSPSDKATSAAETTSADSTSASTSDSSKTTDSRSESSAKTKSDSKTMDQTTSTTSSDTTSTTSSHSTTSTSVSTTTASTSSSTTTSDAAVVTIPPTDGAPYMQTSNTPEGTVFIAVGAILGLIGLAVLAWRGMVAWSVNRSVRNAAMAQAAESKRLLRGSRKKRAASGYTPAPTMDVSLDKLGAATRASYKPSRRVSANQSGLFYSPTAPGGAAGSHNSLNNAPGNRNSNYMPAGFYAAAGRSGPAQETDRPQSPTYSAHGGYSSPQGYPSSPSLPPTGAYHDSHNYQRHSYVQSTSSVNLSQPNNGRAPSAYLEDLFENHPPPQDRHSGRR